MLLRVQRPDYRESCKDVSFELRRGEVLGVAGLVGIGTQRIGRGAVWHRPRSAAGRSICATRQFVPGSPRQAMRAAIGLLPEDRKLKV